MIDRSYQPDQGTDEAPRSPWQRRVLLALIPLSMWGAAYLAAWRGPFVLWDSQADWFIASDWLALHGRSFPQHAVEQMKVPGKRIHPGDPLSHFWGGMCGADGEYFAVWARDGLLIARGDSKSSYFKAWKYFPQYSVGIACFGLAAAIFLWFHTLRPALAQLWERPPGLCEACGYDLRFNESGRCPECGVFLFGWTRSENNRPSWSRSRGADRRVRFAMALLAASAVVNGTTAAVLAEGIVDFTVAPLGGLMAFVGGVLLFISRHSVTGARWWLPRRSIIAGSRSGTWPHR